MDLNNIPLMAALKKRMSWLQNNQTVLSDNIANADTPGYKAKRLEGQDFSGLVDNLSGGASVSSASKTSMRVNDARHMDVGGGNVGSAGVQKTKEIKDNETSFVGNNVVLEEEIIKVANNQMEYAMMVNLYKKNVGLLKMAMGKRQ